MSKTSERPEQQGLSDPKLEEHYQAMFAMFASRGWTDFVRDAEEYRARVSTINAISKETPVEFRLGQVDILNWLINQSEVYKVAYDDMIQHGDPAEAQASPTLADIL